MIIGLGQDEEPEEPEEDDAEPEPEHPHFHHFPQPVTIREPYPYPVYLESETGSEGLAVGQSVIPTWVLVLAVGLLAGYVVGGRA